MILIGGREKKGEENKWDGKKEAVAGGRIYCAQKHDVETKRGVNPLSVIPS